MTSQAWQRLLVLWVIPAVGGCGPPDEEALDGGAWPMVEVSLAPASGWLPELAPEDAVPRGERDELADTPVEPAEPQVEPDEEPAAEVQAQEPEQPQGELECDLDLAGPVEEVGEDSESEPAPAPDDSPGVMLVERLDDGEASAPAPDDLEPSRVAMLIAGTAEGVELVELVEVPSG